MKKGFTLVELLAVIAILAILIILALPNVLGLFMSSKESTFITEAQNVYKVAEEERLIDSMNGSGEVSYSSRGSNPLTNLNKSDLGYYVKFDSNGKITHFIVYNVAYQVIAGSETNTEPILINDICVSSGDCKYKAEQRSAYLLFPGTLSMNIIKKGDIDRTGSIDGDDLIALDEYIKGNLTLDEVNLYSADVNSDGEVNNSDYQELQKHINGEPSTLDNIVTYTVEHYQQKVTNYDDEYSYSMIETDQVEGISGKTSSPLTKNYEGFEIPEKTDISIGNDTTVKYYYNRKKYTVSFRGNLCAILSVDGEGDEIDYGGYSFAIHDSFLLNCPHANPVTHDFMYGMNVSVDTGDRFGIYLNDELQGITTFDFKMPAHDIEYVFKYLEYYTVNHYKQKDTLDGYDLEETETLPGEYNTNVTPAVKSYEGYTAPDTQTILLDVNNKTVNYYYDKASNKPECEDCIYKEDGTNWELALLSSGSVTFHTNESVDVFIVGAGGNSTGITQTSTTPVSGSGRYAWFPYSGAAGGRGGGIKTQNNLNVTDNQSYSYTIGSTNSEASTININGTTYSSGTSGKAGGSAAYFHCGRTPCGAPGEYGGCGYFTCDVATRSNGSSGNGGGGGIGVYAFNSSVSLYNSGVRYGNGGNGYHYKDTHYPSVSPNTGDGAHGDFYGARNGASGIIIIRNHR